MQKGNVTGCLAHSGFATKINMLLVLSSIATMLMGAAFPMLISISSEVALNREKVTRVQKDVERVEKRFDVRELTERESP